MPDLATPPPLTPFHAVRPGTFWAKRFHAEHSSAQNLETFPRRAFTLDVETFSETFPRRHDLESTGSTWKCFANVSSEFHAQKAARLDWELERRSSLDATDRSAHTGRVQN